jgi:hypothetical protein
MVPIERTGKPVPGYHCQQGPQKGQFRAPSGRRMIHSRVQDQDVILRDRCMPISADQGVATRGCRAEGHRFLQPQWVFGSQEKSGLEVCRRRKSHNYRATRKR